MERNRFLRQAQRPLPTPGNRDADLSALEAHTDAGLSALKAELVDRIRATERRTYAAVFAAAGVPFAALKLIP